MEKYCSKVIYDFVNYREYKSRCEYIKFEAEIDGDSLEDLVGRGQGIDYSSPRVQSSNHYDPTAQPVIASAEKKQKLKEELKRKIKLVKRVEKAYSGLDPIEQLLMDIKYKTGRVVDDSEVYTHPNFPYGRTKYYEIKDEAMKKAARVSGYTQKKQEKTEKSKNEQLAN